MGTTYLNFSTGVFHVDGDAPLTQEQVDSVWYHLPTTGAGWVERGRLFVQQFDGAKVFDLGSVARGVKGVSDEVRLGGYKKRHHATKKSSAQLQREIDETLASKGTSGLSARFVAVDPRTGRHLREATKSERARYLQQPGLPAFRKPVRVGKVLVDEDTGPGSWHGGAGF